MFFPNDSFDVAICTVKFKYTLKNNVFLFDADIKIRVLSLPKDLPLVLECANRSAGDKVHWLKEKTLSPTQVLNSNEEVVRIDSETGSLEILKEKEEVYGNYTCKAANATIEYRVVREYSGRTFFRFIEKIIRNKRFK